MKIDISEFKRALRTGSVKFVYIKKDGSERNAYGTLCESMLPPAGPEMATYKLTDLEYESGDADPADYDAPTSLKVKIPANTPEDEIYDTIMDTLYENYTLPFELINFTYERIERAPKKLSADTIFYYDLDKNGFRSFNTSQLQSWSFDAPPPISAEECFDDLPF